MADESEQETRFDQKQYDMLIRCVNNKDTSEWNNWRMQNIDEDIFLAGADFSFAYLEGALLDLAHLEGANFTLANLKGAFLNEAQLEDADMKNANLFNAKLISSNLRSTILNETDLRGAIFECNDLRNTKARYAKVDGETIIKNGVADSETNFIGVGLDAARIDPGLKAVLKNNIRRKQWQRWFAKGNWVAQAFKNCFVRPFWSITGYGSSTIRILIWFLTLALGFAALYFGLENNGNGIVNNLSVNGMPWYHTLIRAIYFSVVTMTTLGFGDLYALNASYWGHVLLMIQVVLGYVLLGALITRLGIVFTGEAPAAEPIQTKAKDKNDD